MAGKITPTRTALLKARTKIKLAKKGHKLLKQKRDVLIMEFFSYLKHARDVSGELNQKMEAAYRSLGFAKAYHGSAVETFAQQVPDTSRINMVVRNVMGIKIPLIEYAREPASSTHANDLAWIVKTSAKIDDTQHRFQEVLQLVFEMARTELVMRRLIREIEKTKRRVNALEYVIIPRLQQEQKLIRFRLDELERDSFFTLKVMKKKLSQKKGEGEVLSS